MKKPKRPIIDQLKRLEQTGRQLQETNAQLIQIAKEYVEENKLNFPVETVGDALKLAREVKKISERK